MIIFSVEEQKDDDDDGEGNTDDHKDADGGDDAQSYSRSLMRLSLARSIMLINFAYI